MSSDTEVHFPGLKKIPHDPLRKRYNHEAKGMILKLETGLIVVPYLYDGDHGWRAVVVGGTGPEAKSYQRGGYDVSIPLKQIEHAEELPVPGLEVEG